MSVRKQSTTITTTTEKKSYEKASIIQGSTRSLKDRDCR
jgi:hypothetical protein